MPRQTRSQSRPATASSIGGNNREQLSTLPEDGPLQTKDDKENVNKSDFQPPSPLGSKRDKSKTASSSKNILSPNRNNHWTHRDSAARLRSSPIEHDSRSAYHHQDRDPRERSLHPSRSNSNRKQDMLAYSVGGELDLNVRSDDEFGPSIEDCLNLGSFAEDSPPREKSYRRPDPRGSPTYQGGYNYGSRAAPPPPPPPDYSRSGYYSHPAYGYPPYPPSHGDHPPWQSPRPYDHARGQPVKSAPGPYDGGSPPSKKSRRWDGVETPDKSKNARSPFRSPQPNPDSAKKFKRSPIWGGAMTPNIGMYGSFGMMDTPGAQLDGFSPMGPSFASFENDSPPLPMEGEVLDERLSLVAGDDARRVPPPSIRQRRSTRAAHDSPGFSFINDMAHMPGTMPIPGSPVRPSRDRERYYSSEKDRSGRDCPPSASHPSVKRPPPGTVIKRHIFASPLTTSSSRRPPPWFEQSRDAPTPMRIELSEMGSRASRNSLEGINTMLRGGVGPPPRSSSMAKHAAYDMQRVTPYHTDMNTPGKMVGSGPHQGHMPSSQSRGHAPPYPGPAPVSGRKAPPMPSSSSAYLHQSPSIRPPGSVHRAQPPPRASTPSANDKVTPGAQSRRSPCNCKKTKCLKLYCECFAAELYCDGCNCSDCKNTKCHEEVRSKAMKDTRAKNPNAFKPRIAVAGVPGPAAATPSSAHNMGCKCKRSECLKKYCECFQAGVMCGNKCKCVDCLNYVGSQALIDKLRKIKDHRGADFAMRLADEAWKGKHGRSQSGGSGGPPAGGRRPTLPSPSQAHPNHGHHMPHHNMMPPNPSPHHPSNRGAPPGYMSYPPPYQPMGGHAPAAPYSLGHAGANTSKTREPERTPRSEPVTVKKQPPTVSKEGKTNQTNPGTKPVQAVKANIEKAEQAASTTTQNPVQAASTTTQKPEHAASTTTQKPEHAASTTTQNPVQAANAMKPVVTPAGPKSSAPVTSAASSGTPAVPIAPSTSNSQTVTPSTNVTPSTSKPQEMVLPHVLKGETSDVSPVAAAPSKTSEMEPVVKVEAAATPLPPKIATPRTPGIRLGFDPSSSKKRRLRPGEKEKLFEYFGECPEQPKTTALAVFAFLSNKEICNARLVSKRWSTLGIDEELWQF